MSQEGREYLSSIVYSVICMPDVFRIGFGNGKYVFSVMSEDATTNEYFAVSATYDSICDTDAKIKYAFEMTLACDFPETIKNYDPFSKPTEQEMTAMYHVENMVFRISILWDLLAQLCNIIFRTGIEPGKIHYNRFFKNHAEGKNAIPICKEVVEYLEEEDDATADVNPWPGNHAYLNDFRNQMTHRVSPNISSISALGTTLRPPVMYVLHRATEDYYKVSSFLCRLINHYLEEHKNWVPFGFTIDRNNQENEH